VRRERWSCRVVGADPVDISWPKVEDDQMALEMPAARLTGNAGVAGTPPAHAPSGVAVQVYDPFGGGPEQLTEDVA